MIFHNPSYKKHVYSVSSVLTNDLCLAGVQYSMCFPSSDLLYVYQVYTVQCTVLQCVFLPVTYCMFTRCTVFSYL